MRHLAIIGSGPAGYYTAEAAQKAFGDAVRIDLIDRMPVPYGLIRYGVAPDHQSIKGVARRFETIALTDTVRFVGHVMIGQDLTIDELLTLYDAVVLATGAPRDRPLDIPGAGLSNVVGSAAFVGWYNGHPDFADLAPDLSGEDVVVIGNGNVALDVARLLAKTPDELAASDITRAARQVLAGARTRRIRIIGRRGPHQIAMTPKELGELGNLARARAITCPEDFPDPETDGALETGQRKSVAHLRSFMAPGKGDPSIAIRFQFYARPLGLEGRERVETLRLMQTRLDEQARAIDTGREFTVPAQLVISCIGYETAPIANVPYDDRAGRFTNIDGRVAPGLYAVGWARRGPSGTIGTNRPDGYAVVDQIAADWGHPEPRARPPRAGRAGLDRLIEQRGLDIVTFRNWQKIDAAEIARAFAGSPREKYTSIVEMIAASR